VQDGSAGAEPELIQLEWRRSAAIEELPRVELGIPQELVNGAVQRIGAGFDGHADDPGAVAVLSRIVVALDLEFLDGVHGGQNRQLAETRTAVFHAIDQVAVVTAARARNVGSHLRAPQP